MDSSPYNQLKQLGFVISRLGIEAGIDRRSQQERRSFESLRRAVRVAQDVAKDLEMSQLDEDTAMQARLLPKTVQSLEKLRASLLAASEYGSIGAVDVAQISAELDELIDRLH